MHIAIVALMVGGLLQADKPAGNADAGKQAWQRRPNGAGPNQAAGTLWCNNCHGMNGEGGFGPDLAGRGLTLEQFRHAVRQPWGWMPRYPEKSVSDQAIADVYAWLSALPKLPQPAAWKTPAPAPAPRGPYVMTVVGCYQCHGAQLTNPRRVLGGEIGAALDFAHFADVIYNHDAHYPQNQMGLFSRDRLAEPILREVYQYLFVDLGVRVPVSAAISDVSVSGGNSVVTLTLTNDGEVGKGLVAEGLTVGLLVPAGAKVVSGAGQGYKGVQRNPAVAGGAEAATWKVSRLAPGAKETLTLTVAGDAPAAGFKGSTVVWEKPALGPAAPSRQDSVAVAIPQPRPAAASR